METKTIEEKVKTIILEEIKGTLKKMRYKLADR